MTTYSVSITKMVSSPPMKSNNISNTNTSLKRAKINYAPNGGNHISASEEGRTRSPTVSNNQNLVHDITMVDNPYSEEDKHERLLNHAINIKVERNMYTTPITLELGQKRRKTSSLRPNFIEMYSLKFLSLIRQQR